MERRMKVLRREVDGCQLVLSMFHQNRMIGMR
jgi:hypothetical protein